jgi:hypothetical protein
VTPRRLLRWLGAAIGTLAALYALTLVSAAPVVVRRGGTARLRLSWSARPERIESCRRLSDAELQQREEHMRQRVECEGRFATYLLRVDADGRRVHESVVRGAGLRNDRPIFLLREIDLPAGAHQVRIRFTRREKTDDDAAAFAHVEASDADTGIFAGRAQREAVEHERRARAAIPPRLELDSTLVFRRDRAIVVTLDADRRVLKALDRLNALDATND